MTNEIVALTLDEWVDGDFESQPGTYSVKLVEHERMWNPCSTTRRIHGPAKVLVIVHPDLGMDVAIA